MKYVANLFIDRRDKLKYLETQYIVSLDISKCLEKGQKGPKRPFLQNPSKQRLFDKSPKKAFFGLFWPPG